MFPMHPQSGDSRPTALSRPIDPKLNPLATNVQEIVSCVNEILRNGSPSPGDPQMWLLYQELPPFCRKLFGSKSLGPGQLELGQAALMTELLKPEGPVFQSILKAASEKIFFDINLDVLPAPVQRLFNSGDFEGLPSVFRDRLQAVTFNAATMQTGLPTTAAAPHAVLKFNMTEYYLLYFIYFALLDFKESSSHSQTHGQTQNHSNVKTLNGQQDLHSLKKTISILSHAGGLDGAQSAERSLNSTNVQSGTNQAQSSPSKPKRFQNYKRKPLSTGAYASLLQRYLDFFLVPLTKKASGADHMSRDGSPAPETNPSLRKRADSFYTRSFRSSPSLEQAETIWTCRYLDRPTQIRVATFFIQLLCQLWLGQNEFYVSTNPDEPLVLSTYEAPTADLLKLVLVVENQIIKLDLHSLCRSILEQNQYMIHDDLQQPSLAVARAAYFAFKFPFYHSLRLLYDLDVSDIPISLMYDLYSKWIQPWHLSGSPKHDGAVDVHFDDVWKFFLTDNLPFYTTLFNAFLQVLSARSPMNTIVVGLSNANPIDSAPCIGSSSMLDFNTLKMLLKNVYHCCPDLLLWLRVCEISLCSPKGQITMPTATAFPTQSPMFGGMDEIIQHLLESGIQYQNLLFENYGRFDLAALPKNQVASSKNQDIEPLSPVMNGSRFFESNIQAKATASHYQPFLIDDVLIVPKKILKKFYTIIAAEDAWLKKFNRNSRQPGAETDKETSANKFEYQKVLSGFLSVFGENKEKAIQDMSRRVSGQRELLLFCIQSLESLYHQITDEDKQALKNHGLQQIIEGAPSMNTAAYRSPSRARNPVEAQQEYYSRILNTPDTVRGNPLKLTQKGREQIRQGLRKCTNRDVVVISDPADIRHIKNNEIGVLVKPLVTLGFLLNGKWSPGILQPIEEYSRGWIIFPESWHDLRWESVTRLLAVKSNIIFLFICWLVITYTLRFLSLIFHSSEHTPIQYRREPAFRHS